MKGEGDAPKPPAAALLAAPNRDGVEAAPNAGVLAPPTGACTQGEGAASSSRAPDCITFKGAAATWAVLTEPKLNICLSDQRASLAYASPDASPATHACIQWGKGQAITQADRHAVQTGQPKGQLLQLKCTG